MDPCKINLLPINFKKKKKSQTTYVLTQLQVHQTKDEQKNTKQASQIAHKKHVRTRIKKNKHQRKTIVTLKKSSYK